MRIGASLDVTFTNQQEWQLPCLRPEDFNQVLKTKSGLCQKGQLVKNLCQMTKWTTAVTPTPDAESESESAIGSEGLIC